MHHHGAGLRRLTKDPELIEELLRDYRTARLEQQNRSMLDYAVKLTLHPWAMQQVDVESLRQAGFDDSQILDINQICGYFAFVNRLADGLGVELEQP